MNSKHMKLQTWILPFGMYDSLEKTHINKKVSQILKINIRIRSMSVLYGKSFLEYSTFMGEMI